MHVMIINGSPRVKKFSNTDKILAKFTEGLGENGTTFEIFEVSDRSKWDEMRKAYYENKDILIALPLYVECIPGMLMEFLETLERRNDGARIAFILQSGFAEGIQLRCGEAYLKILAQRLGCEYKGTLVKGNNFGIRLMEGKAQESMTAPYTDMGREFAAAGDFDSEKCRKFTGPEIFNGFTRFLVGGIFLSVGKRMFDKSAASWGCTKPLNDRPYVQD